MLHKSVYVTANAATARMVLDITPDDDNPSVLVSAFDEFGNQLAQTRVEPPFKLNAISATEWIESDFSGLN